MSNLNLVFKDYNPEQIILLPSSLEELIADNYPVHVINDVIERINFDPLLKS